MRAALLALSALKASPSLSPSAVASLSPVLGGFLQINPCSTSYAVQHASLRTFPAGRQPHSANTPAAQPSTQQNGVEPFAVDPKLPYDVMRAAIYDSDLHVEQIGELAKFMKIRRAQTLYGDTLESAKMLRVLLGGINRRHLVRYLERARRTRLADRRWAFMSLLEARLDMTLLRTGLTHNIRMAQNWVRHNRLLVNGQRCNRVARETRPGDVIAVPAATRRQVLARLAEDVDPFFAEVAAGGPARRAVYYTRGVRVGEAGAGAGGVVRLGLGGVVRKVLVAGNRKDEEGRAVALGAGAAAEAVRRAVDSSSEFNAGRRRRNRDKHPYRMTMGEVRGAGGLVKGAEEQVLRSFRAMLRQEVAGAGAVAGGSGKGA